MKNLIIALLLTSSLSFSINGYMVIQESKGKEAHVEIESVSTVYIIKNAMRIDTKTDIKMDMDQLPDNVRNSIPPVIKKETSLIQKISDNKVNIFSIDHQKKTYTDFSHIPEFMILSFMSSFIECDPNTNKCYVKKDVLKPTNEYKRIGKYRVRKIIIKAGGMQKGTRDIEVVAWFTKDNKDLIGAEKMKINLLIKAAKMTDFGKNNPDILKDLKKFVDKNIKMYGVPIKWEMQGGEVSIRSVKKMNINKNLFNIPKGYTEVKAPF